MHLRVSIHKCLNNISRIAGNYFVKNLSAVMTMLVVNCHCCKHQMLLIVPCRRPLLILCRGDKSCELLNSYYQRVER